MTTSRRNLLKAGTSTLIGGLLASAGRAVSAQETTPAATINVKSVPPLAATVGMRLATCALGAHSTPSLVIVLDNGMMIDVKVEAARQKIKLRPGADPMLTLIRNGNAGLEQLRALVERAEQR